MGTTKINIQERIRVLKDRMEWIDNEMRDLFEMRERALSEYANLKHNKTDYLAEQEQKILRDVKAGKVLLVDAETGKECKVVGFY